ncbi:MAG: putative molybdopterin synthase [ANME-2 cluster archaeon]|nr:putative molybdopterin synthase [ANME-2 cluster archaeon]
MKIISVTGYKKSGKTTLVEQLVRELAKRGSVGTIKHMPGHDLNPYGTDTGKYMNAGAMAVLGVTSYGSAKFIPGTDLENALDELANSGMDYAVVEGFKDSRLPKIILGDLELPDEVARLDDAVDLADEVLTNLLEIIEQQPEYHTLDSLIIKVRQNPGIAEAGAIGSFTGIVRGKTGDMVTKSLEFESYNEVAANKISLIETDLKACEGILDVRIHHRVGRIEAGQDILYIVVAASHRQQLFQALSDAIERVKAEVPIWKKEYTTTGEFWVQDHS